MRYRILIGAVIVLVALMAGGTYYLFQSWDIQLDLGARGIFVELQKKQGFKSKSGIVDFQGFAAALRREGIVLGERDTQSVTSTEYEGLLAQNQYWVGIKPTTYMKDVVFVFEYTDKKAAMAAARRVVPAELGVAIYSPDKMSGQWYPSHPARFYLAGKLIVVYDYQESDIIELLDRLLGPPFVIGGEVKA